MLHNLLLPCFSDFLLKNMAGVAHGCSLIGTATGPLIATALHAYLGSYDATFWVLALLPLFSGSLVVCLARAPDPPASSARLEGAGE